MSNYQYQDRLEDMPVTVRCRRGRIACGDYEGMEFLSRVTLVREHLEKVLRTLGAANATKERLLAELDRADAIDSFAFESNGEDPFKRAEIRVHIEAYRGALGNCLGDPCRAVEERL